MIKVENATQIYGKQVIFEQVNFQIGKGERVAIVGKNGAGKTTLLHALLGFSRLEKGKITVYGKPVYKQGSWEGKLSYLPEKFQLYGQLTVEENVAYFANTIGLPLHEVEKVLKHTNMWEHREKRMTQLSKGMLQRTGLSVTLLGEPSWIVLDEPTSGLDPFGRADIMQLMRKIGTPKRTILFTTHHMNEVKEIATHVLYLEEKMVVKMNVNEFFQELERSIYA